jgi:hypothetical protein
VLHINVLHEKLDEVTDELAQRSKWWYKMRARWQRRRDMIELPHVVQTDGRKLRIPF